MVGAVITFQTSRRSKVLNVWSEKLLWSEIFGGLCSLAGLWLMKMTILRSINDLNFEDKKVF